MSDRTSAGKKENNALKKQTVRCVLLYAALTVVIAVVFVICMIPQKYDIKVGQVPTVTIAATRDVVDEVTTEQRRAEAAAAVPATYVYQDGVTETVLAQFDQIFSQLRVVRQYGETLDHGTDTGYTREELSYAASMLTGVALRDYQLVSLLSAEQEKFDALYEALYSALKNTMNGHVTEGQENEAIQNISMIIGFKADTDLLQNVAIPVLRSCVRPNMVIDQTATENARAEARNAVENVVYKQGQNIVVKGEGRVTSNQIRMLSTLGLLDDEQVDLTEYLGMALLIIAAMALVYLVLGRISQGLTRDFRRTLIFCLATAATVVLCAVARLFHPYLMPVILAALLLTSLDSIRAGLTANTLMTLLMTLLAMQSMENDALGVMRILLTGLLSGTAACLIMRKSGSRLKPLIAGIAAAVINFGVLCALNLVNDYNWSELWRDALLSMSGPVLAGLLAMALQPLLESLFNLPTPVRLLELSNPNQPLLKRLMMEAPGTYHHSILVANLAEASAEAVSANPLLARVGAYYHDIGKLKRPQYFSENQSNGENVHDHTDPEVSAKILTSHTRDGVALAREYRLPAEIQKIISDHHGNSPVMYFYHKAVQQAGGKPVDINIFRYDGNRPSTKEAAIIMLCDTIEAAVRSRKDNMSQEELEGYIVKLVRGKLSDGQLNDAPLTLRDIDDICSTCTIVLKGVNHERVAYPGDRQPRGQGAARKPGPHQKESRPGPSVSVKKPSQPAPVAVPPPPAPENLMVDDILQEQSKVEEVEVENAPAFILNMPDMNDEPADEPAQPAEQDANNE